MATRTHDTRPGRVRLTVILFLCLGLALGSFWLLQLMRKDINDKAPGAKRNDPDYFVDGFTFVRLAPTGQAHYVVTGDHLVHRPQDDTAEVTHPRIQSFAPRRAPVTVRSATAFVTRDASRVDLNGNVTVDRPAQGADEALHLATPTLTVFPDDETMRTAAPVQLKLGGSTLTGTGMDMDNAKRTLRLHSNGHATLHRP